MSEFPTFPKTVRVYDSNAGDYVDKKVRYRREEILNSVYHSWIVPQDHVVEYSKPENGQVNKRVTSGFTHHHYIESQ